MILFLAKHWKAIVGLILLAAVWGHGYHTKAVACEAAALAHEVQDTKAQLEAHKRLIEAERRHADEMARIAEAHEQDKRNAEADHERLVDDLRAGNVRLQNRWNGCRATSAIASGAAEPDAAARDREESAARIVRAARDADDWIKRLQDVIRSDREQQ